MSVTVRSPVVVRRSRRSKGVYLEDTGCWEESVCSGDKLINEHANRISWWLVGTMVVVALILLGVIFTYANNTATTGSWSTMHPSTWIAATPHAMASLLGITVVLDSYTTYMIALKKGHLDRYVGQFLLGMFIKLALIVFFSFGLAHYGSIGSMFSILGLTAITLWSFLTSHSHSPLFAWLHLLVLAWYIFLIVYLATSGVKIWPS